MSTRLGITDLSFQPKEVHLKILQMIADDEPYAEISKATGLTQTNVYSRIAYLRKSHGFSTRAALIAHAIRREWIV